MIHETTYDPSVKKAFDVGHSRYIETASGTNHMYFLLGNNTKPIQYGMRCKDYLQEVFLCKRFKKTKTSHSIYGYNLRGVKNATRLYLKFPDKKMSEYKDNIHRCIKHINNTYDISISVCVLDEYIELRMPLNWFTDKINPVEASVISTLLRSCMVWRYDTVSEMLENIEEIEDMYEDEDIFPDKDWNGRGDLTLKFLQDTRSQKILGRWDFCNQMYRKCSNTTYHNRSGWVSCYNFKKGMRVGADMLDLLEQMTPSTSVSDPCILIDANTNRVLCSSIIKNKKDLKRALNKVKSEFKPCLLFNNAMLHTDSTYNYDVLFTNDIHTVDRSIQYSKISLLFDITAMETQTCSYGSEKTKQLSLLNNYDIIRLTRLLNSLAHEKSFRSDRILETNEALKTSAKTVCFEIFRKHVLSKVKTPRALAVLDRLDVLKKLYNYYKS